MCVRSRLSGVAQMRIGTSVGGAFEALEVADGHRHEVRRHLRRRRELHRVLRRARARRVRQHLAVGDRGVAAIDRQRDGERRLERRLVEARERAARVGRLELRDRVLPQLGLADVEAAQLGVQDAAVADVDLGGAFRRAAARTVSVAVCAVSSSVTVAICAAGAGADRHLAEIDLERVQHDRARSARRRRRESSRCRRSARGRGRRRTPDRSAQGTTVVGSRCADAGSAVSSVASQEQAEMRGAWLQCIEKA